MGRAPRRAFLVCAAALALAASVTGVGCGWWKAPINANPSLRWWLFSRFGADRICPEMLERSAPLRLTPDSPVIGRFFPNRCQALVSDERRTVTLQFAGTGYAWTPVAGRVGFASGATVEYVMDFRMMDDAVYVWGRPARIVEKVTFQIGSVENPLFDAAQRSPVGYLTATFAAQLVESKLSAGFTVVRSDEGDAFTLGVLEPPARPAGPLAATGSEHEVLDNDIASVHHEQVDFLGPFALPDDGQALYVRMQVAGPPVEVLVYPRSVADGWRDAVQRGAPIAAPALPPITGFAVQPGVDTWQKLALPPGSYVLVLDNTSRVGRVGAGWNPLGALGASTATVTYRIERGQAD